MDLITKKLRRPAHGLRKLRESYGPRLLVHPGAQWQTVPTARIRARHARLLA